MRFSVFDRIFVVVLLVVFFFAVLRMIFFLRFLTDPLRPIPIVLGNF